MWIIITVKRKTIGIYLNNTFEQIPNHSAREKTTIFFLQNPYWKCVEWSSSTFWNIVIASKKVCFLSPSSLLSLSLYANSIDIRCCCSHRAHLLAPVKCERHEYTYKEQIALLRIILSLEEEFIMRCMYE